MLNVNLMYGVLMFYLDQVMVSVKTLLLGVLNRMNQVRYIMYLPIFIVLFQSARGVILMISSFFLDLKEQKLFTIHLV